jgi:hypothetical protein
MNHQHRTTMSHEERILAMKTGADNSNSTAQRQNITPSFSNETHPRPRFSRAPSVSFVDDPSMRNESSPPHQPALVSPFYNENEDVMNLDSFAGTPLLILEERNTNTANTHGSASRHGNHHHANYLKPTARVNGSAPRSLSLTNSSSVNLPKSNAKSFTYTRDEAITGSAASVLMLMKLSSSTDGRSALDAVAVKEVAANADGPAIDNHHNAVENTPPRQFPLRLALPEDSASLNALHCYVRSHLLETCSDTTSSLTGVRRVGLRCVHCAHVPRKDRAQTRMAMFFPKRLEDLYRQVCRWQGLHFLTCPYIPVRVIEDYNKLKESDKTRGNTRYWISSAERLGLVNIVDRTGICFFTTPSSCCTLSSSESHCESQY